MTVAKVRSLLIELGFDIKNLKKAQEVEDAVENIVSGMERLTSVARTVATALIGFGTALTLGEKASASWAAEMQRTADGLGVHVERLQELGFAYGKLKIDHAEMIDSFQKLSDRVEKAAGGSKEYQRVFKMLNLNAAELKKLDMPSMYQQTLKGIAALEDPQKRLAALTGVFGETLARKLAPALANNGDLLRKYMQLARDAGAIMGKDQVEALTKLDFAFARMQVTFTAIRNEIAVGLAPLFERMVGRIWQWYQANRELVKVKVAEAIDRISTSMETAWGMAKQLNAVVQQMGGWLRMAELAAVAVATALTFKVGNALVLIGGGIKALIGAIAAVGGKFVGIFLLVVGAVLLTASAMDEMAAEARGAETLVGHLGKKFDELHPVLQALYIGLRVARENLEIMAAAAREFLFPALMKLRPILGLLTAGLIVVATAVTAAIGVIFLLGTAIVVVVAEFWSFVLLIGKLIVNLVQLGYWFGKLVENGFKPGSVAALKFKEQLLDIVEAISKVESLNWIGKQLGVDFEQKVKFHRTDPEGMMKKEIARGTARISAAAAQNTTNTQQVKVEQRNEFIIQGSMDEAVGQRVVRQTNDSSQKLANSINNAARGGNR